MHAEEAKERQKGRMNNVDETRPRQRERQRLWIVPRCPESQTSVVYESEANGVFGVSVDEAGALPNYED
jgi:hypothetical protein